jgi:hypothetical protein
MVILQVPIGDIRLHCILGGSLATKKLASALQPGTLNFGHSDRQLNETPQIATVIAMSGLSYRSTGKSL